MSTLQNVEMTDLALWGNEDLVELAHKYFDEGQQHAGRAEECRTQWLATIEEYGNRKAYRPRYRTLAAWVMDEFGVQKTYAHDLIAWSRVNSNLSAVRKEPLPEGTTRILAPLPPRLQVQAVQQAEAKGEGNLRPADVREAVAEIQAGLERMNGTPDLEFEDETEEEAMEREEAELDAKLAAAPPENYHGTQKEPEERFSKALGDAEKSLPRVKLLQAMGFKLLALFRSFVARLPNAEEWKGWLAEGKELLKRIDKAD